MINGEKIRGSDVGLNLILINSIFHKVTPHLVSFEMVLTGDSVPNIYCIGYSKHNKQLYIHFRNDKRYIYNGVSVDDWQKRHNYLLLNQYYATEIKGKSYHQTDEYVQPLTNEYVLEAYNKLDYYATITDGLYATDSPHKIIDTEGILFELEPFK